MTRFAEGDLVAVLTTQPLDRTLDYKAPAGGCGVGDFVAAPLGPRAVLGVVWGPGRGDFDPAKVRPLQEVLNVPPMRDEMRTFLERAADYTLTPMPAMLRLATRSPALGGSEAKRIVYRRGTAEPARMTDARRRTLDAIEDFGGASVTLGELSAAAGVSSGVIKGLLESGALVEEEAPRDGPYPELDHSAKGMDLNAEQRAAAEALTSAMESGGYGTTLLKGVTGSGKTEVYLEAVAATLAAGRQALVLLPEIALTAEFLTRVERRFGACPAEWHSGVTQTERRRCWRMVASGGARMVVGARSALFLPFQHLGLIVVDEEHDTSYKQEDGVLYNARDMAVLRASIEGAQVVLASATPSLETWANAESGKYNKLELRERAGAAEMPRISTIDMRREKLAAARWLSEQLAAAVQSRLDRAEQALLFLNRRGYAPVTLCRACGKQIGCRHCDARMVEHRFRGRLICHQCGDSRPVPDACPECGVEGRLAAVGPGVERLGEEVAGRFPNARVEVLSSDLFGSARALKARIGAIAAGGADIVIGTQIVAKGHNFPKLTLVGVVDADLGLQGSDLRAAERTFQLMRQVAGRAGRGETTGEALLQTWQPEHPVIRAIVDGDEETFWRAEAAERRAFGMPPYGRMAGIVLSSTDMAQAFDVGNELARRDEPLTRVGAQLWGPAPAPIARIRGRHRVRLLAKAPKGAPLQTALAEWAGQVKLPNGLRMSIDIDPQSFL